MAPAGLGQHARRRPISREGASERPPLRAGEGTLPVHGAVPVPVGTGVRAARVGAVIV